MVVTPSPFPTLFPLPPWLPFPSPWAPALPWAPLMPPVLTLSPFLSSFPPRGPLDVAGLVLAREGETEGPGPSLLTPRPSHEILAMGRPYSTWTS